ncbi:hypothetical protein, partial [Methylorubrum thiocyanatum]|uniref:hypothetical protein n=1 Tax=Methylorubrum thiocyanatum TaxID=47958 RepID=UPI001EFB3F95
QIMLPKGDGDHSSPFGNMICKASDQKGLAGEAAFPPRESRQRWRTDRQPWGESLPDSKETALASGIRLLLTVKE